MQELLERAFAVARHAHQGQLYGDQLYITHVLAVVYEVGQRSADPIDKIIAYLHDVAEDSQVTLAELTQEFGAEVGAALDALTKRPSDANYTQYIRRLAPNPRARRVKICDLLVNIRNIYQNGRKRKNLTKYQVALNYLTNYEEAAKEAQPHD